ncbi:MAG TPA: hypothetical protein DEP87_03525 [Candidatus Pacebacteria bacterium]|nr:hypothetical protein [Candidatus Paceibacterota bacterium]
MRSWAMPLVVMGLAVLSLVMLKSLTPDLVLKQTLALSLGGLLIVGLSQRPFLWLQRQSQWLYWGLELILGWLLIIGTQTRGTVGWFELGAGFNFQPSQMAVPIVSLFLVTKFPPDQFLIFRRNRWSQLLQLLGLWLLPAVLIGLEPDFGSLVVYLAGTGILLSFYAINFKWWLGLGGLSLVALALAWQVVFQPYQKDRILSFLQPSSEISEITTESSAQYNARQALIAVGSGELWGRGLGYGIQSHLRFLPERQTDFIFSALAEELGFVGTTVIIGCYIALLGLIFHLALLQTQLAQKMFLVSFGTWLFIQTAINLGMNLGLLPITGITLPFVSYGGSSVLGLALGLGIVQAISRETQKKLVLHIR